MRIQIASIAILLTLIFSCQRPTEKQLISEYPDETSSLETTILGTWENVSLSTIIYTANNTDSTKTDHIPREEWEERLQIKPILTTYLDNGSFVSEYRDLNDSLVNKSEGSWQVKGDSLGLTSDGSTTYYHVHFKNDTATFTGYLDWDGDGHPDDLYKGVQRKL